MADGPVSAPSQPQPETLHYATPAQRVRHIRPVRAMIGGVFLVLVGAMTLLLGFVMIAEYNHRMPSDFGVTIGIAVCVFSAVCLFAGIPLIYRGSRGED